MAIEMWSAGISAIQLLIGGLGVCVQLRLLSCTSSFGDAAEAAAIQEPNPQWLDRSTSSSSSKAATATLLNTTAEIPTCNAERKAQLVYVLDVKQFQSCDGSSWSVVDIKGEKGDAGAKGDKGDAGAKGDKGDGVVVAPGDVIPAGATTLTVFGHSLTLDDDLLAWSCNQFMFDF